MILKKILIHNLASIEDAVIDFTESPLKDEPLFLINGPTGSGKSTILDAVCLALFGQTPRLFGVGEKSVRFSSPFREKEKGNVVTKNDTISLDDVRQIMRRGTGECYAAVVFTTPDGTDYEARWTARKARNRVDGRLQGVSPSLTNLKTGISVTKSVAKEVEQLIHLNYEQFCRTSMLAQGEFTKFLQSNSSEKSQILEKLTGTEIYSAISKKIAEMASRKKEEAARAHMLPCDLF
jgi:exonuclease SbcC